MEADATDDPTDTDYVVQSNHCGVWSPGYLRRFTRLLANNTVLLQSLYHHPRDDPIQELKRRALEAVRVELRMESANLLRTRILAFKKLAATRARQHAERCSPTATYDQILRTAPRWLRDLAPHLDLLPKMKMSQRPSQTKALPTASADPASADPASADPASADPASADPASAKLASADPAPLSSSVRVAAALVARARALRSLEARVVCRDLGGVPACRQEELQYTWWRMLDVVRQKLSIQRDAWSGGAGGAGDAAGGAGLSAREGALAELVLLLDDTICTIPDNAELDSLQELVSLFHLVQQHALETRGAGKARAGRWRAAHKTFLLKHNNRNGVHASLVLLQRRWHELKLAARHAFARYARAPPPAPAPALAPPAPAPAPSPLHTAIVKRYPHVVTSPARSWRDLVAAGLVVEDNHQSIARGPPAARPPAARPRAPAAPPRAPSSAAQEEDDDDLMVIEEEIETIDLIGPSEESPHSRDTFDDDLLLQLKSRRENMAEQLESELEQHLHEMGESGAGASETGRGRGARESEMALCRDMQPCGPPTFIYDSGSDVEVEEDRLRNIEMIASQLTAEEGNVKYTARVKEEVLPTHTHTTRDNQLADAHIQHDVDDDDYIDDDDVDVEAYDVVAGEGDEGGRGGGGGDAAEDSDDDCIAIDEKLLMVTQISLERVDASQEWKRHAKRTSIHLHHLPARYRAKRARPTHADETHADETHADKTHADETHADESHADETHAVATQADESNADETHADESNADETHADETHAEETHADGTHADAVNATADKPWSVCDLKVNVKVEKIKDDETSSSGERRGKLRARQRIAEMLRDTSPSPPASPPWPPAPSPSAPPAPPAATPSPPDDETNARLTKKVQLPNIEEVRKNNMSMLTAQVAPLSSEGEGEGGPPDTPPTDSPDELRIDEDYVGIYSDVPTGISDDVTTANDFDAVASNDVSADDTDKFTLSRNELDNILQRLNTERADVRPAHAAVGMAQCCPARRQHAVNAARRRLAARAQRRPPPDLNLHDASACARGAACTCCCAHLLSAATIPPTTPTPTTTTTTTTTTPTTTPSTEGVNDVATTTANKKISKKGKNNSKMDTPAAPPAVASDLQEWIRQKNLNQQYFNLNLKTKPPQPKPKQQPQPKQQQPQTKSQPQSLRKILPKPPQANQPPPVLLQLNQPQPNQPEPTSADSRQFLVIRADAPSPAPSPSPATRKVVYRCAPPSPAVPPLLYKLKPNETQPNASTNNVPVTVTSAAKMRQCIKIPFNSSSQLKLQPSGARPLSPLSVVAAPSRALPGRTLIKLTPLPARPAPGAGAGAGGSPTKTVKLSKVIQINSKSLIRPRQVEMLSQIKKLDAATLLPVKIAPKPTDGNTRTPTAGSTATAAPAQATVVDSLRGTGLTVTKISSTSVVESRSLLKSNAPQQSKLSSNAPQQVKIKNDKRLQQAKLDKNASQQAKINSNTPQQAKLNNKAPQQAKTNNNAPQQAKTNNKAPQQAKPHDTGLQTRSKQQQLTDREHIEKLFQQTELTILPSSLPVDDSAGVAVLCTPRAGSLLSVLHYYVVSEHRLPHARPHYWSFEAQPQRLLVEQTEESEAEGGGGVGVMTSLGMAPRQFLRVRVEPPVYARVLFGVVSAEQCRAELVRRAPLHLVDACSAERTPLRLARPPAPLDPPAPVQVTHRDHYAASVLNKILSQLPPLPAAEVVGGGGCAREDVNSRADVIMLLNNVSRKPIEMVHLDSDEEERRTFQGLEAFEDIEDFDL